MSRCPELEQLSTASASSLTAGQRLTSVIVTAGLQLPMSAIPPTVKWDPGLAEIALLGVLVQPPLHTLVAEVILTLVAGVPVGPCIWHVCT